MLYTAVGISDDIDIDCALAQVLDQCRNELGKVTPQVGILFSSCVNADFRTILLKILKEFPDIQLIGCTTEGEISHQTGGIEDSLALLVMASDTLEFATAIATNLHEDAVTAYKNAFLKASTSLTSPPVCAFTFPDSQSTVGVNMESVIVEAFGHTLPVFGGTSGDQNSLSLRYQFLNGEVYNNAAPLLLIAGPLVIKYGVTTGMMPTGRHYKVGRHQSNIVYEIDGKPALDFFRLHLGGILSQIREFPLAVYEDSSSRFFLRNPIGINEMDGSIVFSGLFPKQCSVRFNFVSRTLVLESASQANVKICKQVDSSQAGLILIFASTLTRHLLGTKNNDKFSHFHQSMPATPLFGCYCYNEIARDVETNDDITVFHNNSYVVVALREKTDEQ